MENEQGSDFERAAAVHSTNLWIGELWEFVSHTKKWWLLPLFAVLLLLGLLILMSSTAAAPFIYTLF